MSRLSSQLNRDSNSLIWYGIVGMTDYIIHNKCSPYEYDQEMDEFKVKIGQLNPE